MYISNNYYVYQEHFFANNNKTINIIKGNNNLII